jgi:predicted enzyme related to lactoylglutathione lyase
VGRPIVHFEILGKDHAAIKAFYASQFDWEMNDVMDGYTLVMTAEGSVDGAVGTPPEGMDRMLAIYVQVDSIDDALAGIEKAGGKTVVPRTIIPGMVTWAQFADPAGNVIGLTEAEIPPAE